MKIHTCLLVIILMMMCPELRSVTVGYTRLFEPNTHTTIDILYDHHHNHSKNQLFSSEANLDQILSTLNERNENVDLVWEYSYDAQVFKMLESADLPFLGRYPMHIKENLTNLNFISADRCRWYGYAGLFKWDSEVCINTEGSTFEKPVPFGPERRMLMIKRAGKAVYDNYVKLYEQTVAELTSCFSDAYRSGSPLNIDRDLMSNDSFSKIADLEMLYHILVSDKKRVIVNCGATHARRIAVFLASNGYVPLEYKLPFPPYEEPSLAELEFLYGDGRGLSASINDVPINRDSSLPARAAAEPVLERAVAKPEKKRGFLAASLMVDLPDHRALAQIYQSSISKSAAVKEEYSPQGYRIALGTFEIYFDENATFDEACVSEVLKDVLEDAMKQILKLRGSALSLPFLYIGSDDRYITAVYDTSVQLEQLIAQIERSFRESEAVKAFIVEGPIIAIENKSGRDLPVVCLATVNTGAQPNFGTSYVPPFTITESFKSAVQMRWKELCS